MRRSHGRAHDSRRRKSRTATKRRPQLERLEARCLLTASPTGTEALFSGHSGVCSCPVCTGLGLSDIPQAVVEPSGPAAAPLSSLPQLSSRPGATAKLYLDFNGHFQASWGSWTNATTPVYDQDGDPTTFSAGELASIQEIWARVSEDYAPFNIDVTTIDPGSLADRVVAHIAIGGNYSDWYGSAAGGVAYVGGFYNFAPNVGYVFEDALGNGNAKYVAEAASHEAGHLFGLQHQSKYSGTTLVESYHSGSGDWAPIMGVGYSRIRTTWHNGTTFSSTTFQDDLAILSGANNAFGYVADDYGSTTGTASNLPVSGTSVNLSGLIGRTDDLDVFSFSTVGGSVSFNLAVDSYGPNLDAVLELWNSSGGVITTAAPGGSFGASLVTTIGAGTFYLVARGMGDYGDMGRYTITGTLPAASSEPEITIRIGSTNITDGQTINFGSTNVGTSVDRTFTVVNDGSATLNLTALNSGSLPTGFSIVSNLGSTALAPGQSTTFTLRFNPGSGGSFSGTVSLANDDANENPFDLVLQGTGVVTSPEITLLVGTSNLASGGTVSFGTTTVGTAVTRTITIRNDGDAALTLTPVDPGSLPAGYSIVTNLGSTTLQAGESTTLVLRLDAAAEGTFSGSFQLANSDSDENPYTVNVSGTVSAVNGNKRVIDNGAPGYKKKGGTRITGIGLESDIDKTAKGSGTKYSTWTFNGLENGQYEVWGTWTGGGKHASNAPFKLNTGSGTVKTVKTNQRVAASGVADEGANWKLLGTVTVTKGWAVVKLTNKANGKVVADGIRLVQAPPPAPGASELLVHAGGSSDAGASALLAARASADAGSGVFGGTASSIAPDLCPPKTPDPLATGSHQAHDHVWSQPQDVALEKSVLEETLSLLSESRSAVGEDFDVLDQLLSEAELA